MKIPKFFWTFCVSRVIPVPLNFGSIGKGNKNPQTYKNRTVHLVVQKTDRSFVKFFHEDLWDMELVNLRARCCHYCCLSSCCWQPSIWHKKMMSNWDRHRLLGGDATSPGSIIGSRACAASIATSSYPGGTAYLDKYHITLGEDKICKQSQILYFRTRSKCFERTIISSVISVHKKTKEPQGDFPSLPLLLLLLYVSLLFWVLSQIEFK